MPPPPLLADSSGKNPFEVSLEARPPLGPSQCPVYLCGCMTSGRSPLQPTVSNRAGVREREHVCAGSASLSAASDYTAHLPRTAASLGSPTDFFFRICTIFLKPLTSSGLRVAATDHSWCKKKPQKTEKKIVQKNMSVSHHMQTPG